MVIVTITLNKPIDHKLAIVLIKNYLFQFYQLGAKMGALVLEISV